MDDLDFIDDDNADLRNCKFAFKCEKRWNDLNVISGGDKDIRFCDDCEQSVYRCRTDDQLKYAIRENRCIAVRYRTEDNPEAVELLGLPADAFDDSF